MSAVVHRLARVQTVYFTSKSGLRLASIATRRQISNAFAARNAEDPARTFASSSSSSKRGMSAQNWKGKDVGLPWSEPEAVGLSGKALDRLGPWMKELVDGDHNLPMGCAVVARKGKVVYYAGYGEAKPDKNIEHDSLFRIYSMTKPITSLALMMLWEEGKVLLEHPVHIYLGKKWKKENMKVLEKHGEEPKPCKYNIRVKHLLTHTAGLSYGFLAEPGVNPVDALYIKSAKEGAKRNETLAEMADRIAELPLCHQPGTNWNYSFATDIVGRIVEVVSGKTLAEFFQERFFDPLRMHDTHFFLEDHHVDRFVNVHLDHRKSGQKIDVTHYQVKAKEYTAEKKLLSGGAGLVSTVRDYARFCQFCLNGGELDGVRLIGRKTFDFVTTNHLPDGKCLDEVTTPSCAYMCPPGIGFGLGFAVQKESERSGSVESKGTFYWSGAANTIMFCDPEEELFAMFYTQVLDLNELKLPIRKYFSNMVYSSIVDGRTQSKL